MEKINLEDKTIPELEAMLDEANKLKDAAKDRARIVTFVLDKKRTLESARDAIDSMSPERRNALVEAGVLKAAATASQA